MAGRLDNKLAIVTGAGSGLGRAIARGFAGEGARVIAAAIALAKEREDGAGEPVKDDVGQRADIERLCGAHDKIDVYVNNAGIGERVKPLAQITRAEWDAVIDVNLTALFTAAQVAAPRLKSLIVIGSIIANRPRAGLAAYVASKNGVVGLARALAVELAPATRVNVINPGPANTPMLPAFGFDTDVAQALPLKRLIEPEDIAGAAVYLASDEASAITGAVFNVDGGRDL